MTDISRRRFTKILGSASALATTVLIVKNTSADGHSNMVDPESAQAKGLQFVKVSEKSDKCAGCFAYIDDGSGEKGGCTIFAGGVVPEGGWCAAFAPKG